MLYHQTTGDPGQRRKWVLLFRRFWNLPKQEYSCKSEEFSCLNSVSVSLSAWVIDSEIWTAHTIWKSLLSLWIYFSAFSSYFYVQFFGSNQFFLSIGIKLTEVLCCLFLDHCESMMSHAMSQSIHYHDFHPYWECQFICWSRRSFHSLKAVYTSHDHAERDK